MKNNCQRYDTGSVSVATVYKRPPYESNYCAIGESLITQFTGTKNEEIYSKRSLRSLCNSNGQAK